MPGARSSSAWSKVAKVASGTSTTAPTVAISSLVAGIGTNSTSAPASTYGASPVTSGVDALVADGARPDDDEEIRILPGGHRSSHLRHHLVTAHQVFDAAVVADPLGRDLVFDLDGCGARRLELPHHARHVDRVAEADAAVDDDRQVTTGGNGAGEVGQLIDRQERLGHGEGKTQRSSADVAGLVADLLGEAGSQGIEAERHRRGFARTRRAPQAVDGSH